MYLYYALRSNFGGWLLFILCNTQYIREEYYLYYAIRSILGGRCKRVLVYSMKNTNILLLVYQYVSFLGRSLDYFRTYVIPRRSDIRGGRFSIHRHYYSRSWRCGAWISSTTGTAAGITVVVPTVVIITTLRSAVLQVSFDDKIFLASLRNISCA